MKDIVIEQDLEVITETIELYSTKYTKNTKYYDKDSAIYASITHNNCSKCNVLKKKLYIYCDKCRKLIKLEQYKEKLLLVEWEYPIYSDYFDKYFFEENELVDYIEEYDIKLSLDECLFYSCEANTLPELDYDDLDVEDDYTLPEHIQQLLEQLNEASKDIVISYFPNYKYRIEVNLNNE